MAIQSLKIRGHYSHSFFNSIVTPNLLKQKHIYLSAKPKKAHRKAKLHITYYKTYRQPNSQARQANVL